MIDMREAGRKLFLDAAYWSGAAAFARPWLAGSGAILMLHRVTRIDRSPLGLNAGLAVTPDFLDSLLADLKRRRLAIVCLDELLEGLSSGRRGMVAITADDGWLDNLTEALPVFEAHEAPFTVYVAPGLTSGAVAPWWEAVEEIVLANEAVSLPAAYGGETFDCLGPKAKRTAADALWRRFSRDVPEERQQDLLRALGWRDAGPRRFMDWNEVRFLNAHPLGAIGAHTVHHYNLRRLPEEKAFDEMVRSADLIEAQTGMQPRHFAYPYGHAAAAGEREVRLAARAGFASAVTTRHGTLHPTHAAHPHALPRISVNGRFQRLSWMRALLSGIAAPLANRGRRFVTL